MEFRPYIKRLRERLCEVESLFEREELIVLLDRLRSGESVDSEILYFRLSEGVEVTGLFVFGFNFFLSELGEQEFKRLIGQNSKSFKIMSVYSKLSKKGKKVKVSEILNHLHKDRKDSLKVDETLRWIMTLSYYLNWELTRDKKDIEGDYFIKIPDKFLVKLKQRYNFDIVSPIYENDSLFLFLNPRGKLNLVFKDRDQISRTDISEIVLPTLKKVFGIKNIEIKD